jgi:hypothetical protein
MAPTPLDPSERANFNNRISIKHIQYSYFSQVRFNRFHRAAERVAVEAIPKIHIWEELGLSLGWDTCVLTDFLYFSMVILNESRDTAAINPRSLHSKSVPI